MKVNNIMIIFLIAVSLFLLFGHFLLYLSWVDIYSVTSVRIKTGLGVVLGILGFSFLLTSLLVYWKDTVITDTLYVGASVWLGFLWYAVLAALATVILTLLAKALGVDLPKALIGSMCIGLAVGFSIWGVWNAQHPIVRHVSITFTDLPDAWKGKKIVQLSDIHLGPIHRDEYMNKVAALASNENPYAVFVTGDLFDGGGIHLEKLADPLDDIQTEQGIYYITGNHETYVGVEKSLNALKNLKLTILRDQIVDVEGVQIVGIDYPEPNVKKDVAPVLSRVDATKPAIVLYHEPKFREEIEKAGGDLLLSGHTHKGQMWPFGWITSAVYKKHDYGLTRQGDLQIYTTSGVGTWGPPIRTGNRPEIVVITLD